MTLKSFQALQESGTFKEYPELAAAAISLLPIVGVMGVVTILIGLSVVRNKLMEKQNNAEDKGKISADDKSKYSPKNSNNTVASSDTTVSSPILLYFLVIEYLLPIPLYLLVIQEVISWRGL